MRGDPVKGLPETAWAEALEEVEEEPLLRAAIKAVRDLLIADWAVARRDDERPQKALESAEAWLAARTPDNLAVAKAAAKACTAARNERFGYEHRVPQAARAVAWAVGAKDRAHIYEALASVEEELLARIALTSEYERSPEMRRALVDILRHQLAPAPVVETSPDSLGDRPPVPYSAEGHFELGQKLIHKKFGDVVVTSVGETWIEVELPDATKKRLAHKP